MKNFFDIDIRIRQKVYVILSLISIIFFFAEVWNIKPIIIGENDFLGLISHLTTLYWIGLILIISCSILIYLDNDLKNDYIFMLCLIVVGLFLFGIGIFTQENQPYSVSYYPVGEIKNILSIGHIDSISDYPLISYGSWPSMHIITANFIYLANIKFDDIIKYVPMFLFISLIFIAFVMGKKLKFSQNQSFLFAYILLSSNWLTQLDYTPQSLAYILYVTLFMLLMTLSNKTKDMLLTLIIFAGMVITHLLSSFSILLSSAFVLYFRKKRLIILFLVIFVSWYIYLAPVVLYTGIKQFMEQIVNMDFFHVTTEHTFENVSIDRQIVRLSQLFYLLIYVMIAVVCIIYYILGRVKNNNRKDIEFCLFWLFGVSILTIIRYGTEANLRAYVFALPAIITIMIMSTPDKRKIFVILMILFAIFHIPSVYGSKGYGYQTLSTELKGTEFFASKIFPKDPIPYDYNSTYIYEPSSAQYYVTYYNLNVVKIPIRSIFYKDIPGSLADKADGLYSISKYILYSDQTSSSLLYEFGTDPIKDLIYKNINDICLVYDNGHFNIYRRLTRSKNI